MVTEMPEEDISRQEYMDTEEMTQWRNISQCAVEEMARQSGGGNPGQVQD